LVIGQFLVNEYLQASIRRRVMIATGEPAPRLGKLRLALGDRDSTLATGEAAAVRPTVMN
jgi:hypothetical protein